MTSKKVPTIKFLLSLGFIFLFTFVIASPDLFPKTDQQIVVSSNFVGYDDGTTTDINIDMISIDESDEFDVGVLHYVVQPGDSLGKIASNFGTTVSKIQKVNKLGNSPIRPGQKLIIADEDVGFLYTIVETINVKIFTNKYNLNIDEFMSLNYIQDESEMLYKGQDVFINISNEVAYDNGLLERPKPVVVIKPKITYKPVINKPQSNTTTRNISTSNGSSTKSSIVSQFVYKSSIKNGFYAGYCTWYAAIISPEIFPYISETEQKRDFGGNANQRCKNAEAAGFKVVWNSSKNPVTPSVGALVVYKQGGPNYRSYGHVAKVRGVYPDEGKFLLEEMNFKGKFIVTKRKDQMSNSNISCYIYGK
ncbi:MAG: LysM peptidoglycan-binding domain-containing protein [Candidatus Absconditabacteria bacterium]|nr:LysM peptidoglycan-binding domain-containing protein [Candidatus Absconditabacteria bacterium]